MHNIEDLRKRLGAVLVKYPQSKTQLAKELGITWMGLNNFMNGTPNHMRIWSIIEAYIEKKEREIKLNSNL